jgi:biopolymer transport protein ExbD
MHAARSGRGRHISYRITAMIDMAFLLITFFVMSLHVGQAGEEEINLPDADQAREMTDTRVELITVSVNKDGHYIVGGVRQSASELRKHLENRKEESRRKLEVVIRGDRDTQFEPVQRAMRITAEAGIADVGLAALQNDPSAPVEP